MYTSIQDLLDIVVSGAATLNPDVNSAYPETEWATVWSEGGEWPSYREQYASCSLSAPVRDLDDVQFTTHGVIRTAVAYIQSEFASGSTVVGLSMDCGTGKSTSLVRDIHALKYGKRTIVVQPSLANAHGLAHYMGDGSTYVVGSDQLSCDRTIAYTNAGSFIDIVLSGKVASDDLIVLDEAHSVTLAYEVVRKLLGTLTNMVLMLTASTSSSVKALRGVKLQPVDGFPSVVTDKLASESAHVIVGVTENMSYAASANMLIGVTKPLRVVYDTGLRPEPRVVRGELVHGERLATNGEVLQMMGRLGRCGRSGFAFYQAHPNAMRSVEGLPLYDVLLKSMLSVLGFSDDVPRDKAIKAWKCSGMLSKPKMLPSIADSSNIGDSGGTAPSAEDMSRSASAQTTSSSGSKVRFDLSSLEDQLEDVNHTPDTFSDNDSEGVGVPISRNDQFVTRYKYTKRRSSSGGSSMSADAVVVNRHSGEVFSAIPDPGWRPFRRSSQTLDGKTYTSRDVSKFLGRVGEAVEAGDTLYPCKLPRADPSQVTQVSRMEARMVLSEQMLPSFTEMESLSVVVLWNDTVDSLHGKPMPIRISAQFIEYFKRFYGYENARRVSVKE